MSVSPLKVGLVGYGYAGKTFHAPLIAAVPALELAAVASSDAAKVHADWPGVTVHATPAELVARDDIDLVVIATPNDTHFPLARDALLAGRHVVVDKPFTVKLDDARELVVLARERGRLLSVFHNRRWDGDFLTLKRLVDDGALGRVVEMSSRHDRWRPEVRQRWRESAGPGAGLWFDLGPHLVDQALQLFGPVETVYAEVDRRRPGVQVDDDVFIALHHANGVRSHLWATTLAGTLNPRFRVLGAQATFTKFGLDVQEPQIKAGLRPGAEGWGTEPASDAGKLGVGKDVETVPTEVGRYQDFYAQVRDALRGEAEFPVDPASAVAALRVIEAARQSSVDGRIVKL